jgi:hypothetical protein
MSEGQYLVKDMPYEWTINSLQVMNSPEPQTVVMSNFTIAKLGQQVNYSVNLLPANPDDFTPFDQITQEQALEWTQAALGPERVTNMETEVDFLIAQAAVPTPQPAPLPWG